MHMAALADVTFGFDDDVVLPRWHVDLEAPFRVDVRLDARRLDTNLRRECFAVEAANDAADLARWGERVEAQRKLRRDLRDDVQGALSRFEAGRFDANDGSPCGDVLDAAMASAVASELARFTVDDHERAKPWDWCSLVVVSDDLERRFGGLGNEGWRWGGRRRRRRKNFVAKPAEEAEARLVWNERRRRAEVRLGAQGSHREELERQAAHQRAAHARADTER